MSWQPFKAVITTVGVTGLILGAFTVPAQAVEVPGTPTAVVARASNGQAVVTWQAATSGGEATSYVATASGGGGLSCQATGTPAVTSCTVSGLTNDTGYTFTVTAANAAGTSAASSPSASVTPVAGTQDVNFIGTYGRVKWNEASIGADNSARPWPLMVYGNQFNWAADAVYTTEQVNGGSSQDPPLDCTSAWVWVQIMCDPAPDANSKTRMAKPGFNSGLTIDTDLDPAVAGYQVIDLREPRDFTTLRIWQMFSDGKVTNVELATSSQTGDTWPSARDDSWTTVVPKSSIGPGLKLEADSATRCPTVLDFSATRARYVRLRSWNDGSFGSPSWIEIGGAKLFFEQTPAEPEVDCPPDPPSDVTGVAGDAQATVTWTAPVQAVTGYSLVQTTNPSLPPQAWTPVAGTVAAGTTSKVVTGLTNGTTYYFRVKSLNTTTDPNAQSPWSTTSNAVTPQAGPVPPPTPKTVLKVKSHKGSAVTVNKRSALVKSVRTNGEVTNVRARCLINGNQMRGARQKRFCDLRVSQPPVTAQAAALKLRVTAAPTCSRDLKVQVRVTAKATGAKAAKWSKKWSVRSNPPIVCRMKATG